MIELAGDLGYSNARFDPLSGGALRHLWFAA
ncbi:MAG: hypothetical protein DMG69_08340 [Acidobacteria bacterium]|nr:MAG: hypothetical protein DMG69_08340 [Acidobacteriota bacterium]